MMAITLCFLLATLAFLITAVSTSGPLMLSPFLERNDTHGARTASCVQSNDIPASHSGFITVNKTLGNHLFFWFFPLPPENASEAPLLLWLNGGPGISSMQGLLWENGPLEIVPGTKDQEPTFKRRDISWASHYSIVYVDNPVGTGFSFTETPGDGYRLTQDGYGEDLHSFVIQFFQMFPEYKSRDFYVGGQSYAGRYIPALAIRIHNDLKKGVTRVPLTGIYLGGPYFDSANMMRPFFEYLYSVGAISYAERNFYQERAWAHYQDFLEGRNQNVTLNDIFNDLVPEEIGVPSMGNYVSGKKPDFEAIRSVLTSPQMRGLLKVGNLSYQCLSNCHFFGLYGKDVFVSTTDKLAILMDNYKVLIYTGDYDVVVSSRMVDEALLVTPWSLQRQFNDSSRTPWKGADKELLGFYSMTGRFCRVIIHGAGHQAPHDQPANVLRMMQEFTLHGCIRPLNATKTKTSDGDNC